jgi:hypothetical protein
MTDSGTLLEAQAFEALASCFYDAVPLEFRACAPLAAAVARETLLREGIVANVLACQFRYSGPDCEQVVGFTGRDAGHDCWDGHAICATRTHFIDAAVPDLPTQGGERLPRVMAGSRLALRSAGQSQAIARSDLSAIGQLTWHYPPAGADTRLPSQINVLVQCLAGVLHGRLRRRLAAKMRVVADLACCRIG